VRRQRERGPAERVTQQLEALLARAAGGPGYLQRILVERNGREQLLAVEEIDRLEAARNYVRLHAAGETFLLRHSIGALAERLDPARLLRISRSDVGRLDAVGEVQTWFHGDQKLILKDGTELMWSRRYRGKVRPAFLLA